MTEPTNFKITWGDEETVIEGRTEAVEFAKSKSNDVPMSVNVDSVDETASSTISMTYNGGSLEVYVAETRSNDRRPRKRDRNDEEKTANAESTEETETTDDSSETSAEASTDATETVEVAETSAEA